MHFLPEGKSLNQGKMCKTMRESFKKLISLWIMKDSEMLHKEFYNEEDNGNLKSILYTYMIL